jgi:hypothetical protein
MRIWAGKQKKGVVIGGQWKGAEPLWNIGIHVRSEEVERGLKVSEVEQAIEGVLKQKFPSYRLVISPKAAEVSKGLHDGIR